MCVPSPLKKLLSNSIRILSRSSWLSPLRKKIHSDILRLSTWPYSPIVNPKARTPNANSPIPEAFLKYYYDNTRRRNNAINPNCDNTKMHSYNYSYIKEVSQNPYILNNKYQTDIAIIPSQTPLHIYTLLRNTIIPQSQILRPHHMNVPPPNKHWLHKHEIHIKD